MFKSLTTKHQALLDNTLQAIANRGYWSAFPEMPSPKIYGETALETGKQAFQAHLGQNFPLLQVSSSQWEGNEQSPYGISLNVRYPSVEQDVLLQAAQKAMPAWQALGAHQRALLCIEMLQQIHERSFEIAHAVMMTTGQGWMMAFQAGAAHAQDRGLEAVATAFREQNNVPAQSIWEKPQGKNPPIRMQKDFEIVGRGVALVIGCGTFPTWNTYPGLFAALATGNPVIIKPHPDAILPAAITVQIMQKVLQDYALDPNLVTLFVPRENEHTRQLAQNPAIRSIDFTGSNAFGEWLMQHCPQAQVYAELAGVNHIVIDSTDAYQAMLNNIAFTLSLYSGQMCTTTQVLLIPESGIQTEQGHRSFEQIGTDLSAAIQGLLTKPEVAFAVLGAIQSPNTVKRIEAANAGQLGTVILPAEKRVHPDFPEAAVFTPVLITCAAEDPAHYLQEHFGPISFLVKVKNTDAALALSERITQQQGALTVGIYSTHAETIERMIAVSWRSKVALSINLTESVYVNQSAAYSDYHGTGGNPAANASYTDAAFVANRFRIVQRRRHL